MIDVKSSHASRPTSSCDQCGKSFTMSDNLKKHKPTCTGHRITTSAAPAPATAVRPTGKLQFTLQQTRRALGGAIEQFTANTKEAKRLSTLKKAINIFNLAMARFLQEHRAYKFQVAVSIVFRKAVDPTVVTHPPVVLTSEMFAVKYTRD